MVERLRQAIERSATPKGKMAAAVNHLAELFGVDGNEIAIFHLDKATDGLHFVWPSQLERSGFLPISYRDCLASQTARERKGFLLNRFGQVRHASIFECLKPKGKKGEAGLPIQKIMSAPLLAGEDLMGVIEVCRKGRSPGEAGDDFDREQLKQLLQFSPLLAGLI